MTMRVQASFGSRRADAWPSSAHASALHVSAMRRSNGRARHTAHTRRAASSHTRLRTSPRARGVDQRCPHAPGNVTPPADEHHTPACQRASELRLNLGAPSSCHLKWGAQVAHVARPGSPSDGVMFRGRVVKGRARDERHPAGWDLGIPALEQPHTSAQTWRATCRVGGVVSLVIHFGGGTASRIYPGERRAPGRTGLRRAQVGDQRSLERPSASPPASV